MADPDCRAAGRTFQIIFALALALTLSAWPWTREATEKTGTARLPFNPGDSLHVRNNAGVVDVQTWDRNEVEARWFSRESGRAAEDPQIEFLKRGRKIFLLGSSPFAKAVRMEVKVPPGLDLQIRGIQPEVTVRGVRGNLGVGTLRGRINIVNATSEVYAYSRAGDIHYRLTEQPRRAARLITAEGDVHCYVSSNVRTGVTAMTRQSGADQKVMRGSTACASGEPCLTLFSSDAGRIHLYQSGPAGSWRDGDVPARSGPPKLRSESAPVSDDPPPTPFSSAGGDDDPPAFRVTVDWVRLNVSVAERTSGRRVSGLQIEDFEVYEDGVLQEVLSLQNAEEPFHLLLLLDVSGSVVSYLPLLRQAVLGFAESLRASDRIAVAAFNTKPVLAQDFTGSRKSVSKALSKIPADGGTGLYRALGFGMDHLRRVEGLKALVVFTDGVDDTLLGMYEQAANVTFSEVFDKVQESDALVYIISLDSEKTLRPWLAQAGNEPLADPAFREARAQVEAISGHSGTPLYSPTKVAELPPIFAAIANDLSNRYTLAYRSNNPVRDGRRREIKIQIAGHPEYAAQTRKGY